LLAQFGVSRIYHYAPLHYLPFIARRGALLSKTELRRLGFRDSHFRTTSRAQDEQRGFARYVHLTLDAHPPILLAKLEGGFPHFEVAIPAARFDALDYSLCRFNIAKTRYLRGGRQEPPECDQNGRYYGDMRLPIATTLEERKALLRHNYGKNMIEVLVPEQLPLVEGTAFRFFDDDDLACARQVLHDLSVEIYRLERDARLQYGPSAQHREAVRQVLLRAVADPSWLGSGLEFDRV
jgi:hypothetical protein